MAAITRVLLSQTFVQSLPSLARLFIAPANPRFNARNLSVISRLQPVFPERPDEFLYESTTDEYEAINEADVQHFTKSYPCDALAAAATERNLELATSLVQEYQKAKIDIIHRPEYENLANICLSQGDFDSYISWLSRVPAISGGVPSPTNTGILGMLSRDQLLINQSTRLLALFAHKGWSGRVATDLVSILAQYMAPKEFKRIFDDILRLHRQACTQTEECRRTQAIWQGHAVSKWAQRNDPETAFDIYRQNSAEILEFSPNVVISLYHSARRNGFPALHALRTSLPPVILLQIENDVTRSLQFKLTNAALTREGLRLGVQRGDTLHPLKAKSIHPSTVAVLRAMKQVLAGQRHANSIDPKAISFFFHALTNARNTRLVDLFRRRVYRLGNMDKQTLWGTVEMELLCLQTNPQSAIIYYRSAFHSPASPQFIRSEPRGRWAQWISAPPKHLPPLPPRPLRPSAASVMSVWKAAIMLSVEKFSENINTATNQAIESAEDGAIQDTSHLIRLFIDFLDVYDHYSKRARTFFSNIYTQTRFFELFLRQFAAVEPERCSWVIQSMQQRNIRIDHRIWAIYAKTKVDAGEPQFMLSVFDLLQKESGRPLDFSPKALKDLSKIGMKPGMEHSETDILVPQKIFNAYVYGFRQLVVNRAFREALVLHRWILDAGYRDGTSMPFDRLVFVMLDGIRPYVRRARRHEGDTFASSHIENTDEPQDSDW